MKNYYIGLSLNELFQKYRDTQDAISMGEITSVQPSPGIRTDFDSRNVNNSLVLARLEYAIISHPDADANDPIISQIISNQRTPSTRVQFNACQ